MRNRLHSTFGRPHLGWLWPVVLLILPNCSFQRTDGIPSPNPNPLPHTSLVFCDIEKPLERHCATAVEKATGVRLNAAAVALVAGQSGGNIGLDESPAARARCGGEPEAVTFRGPFPTGNPLCVNGFAIGPPFDAPPLLDPPFLNPDEACASQCEHFFGHFDESGAFIPDLPPDPSVAAFCKDRAHGSTNVAINPIAGVAGGCTPGGMEQPNFADARQIPEPVLWQDLIGVSATANTLTRTAPTSPPANDPPFDAGAASNQVISRGDGYVEFSAAATDKSAVCGFSRLMGPDIDPSLIDLSFSISLNKDNLVYVIEANTQSPVGFDLFGPFGAYSVGERFRVTARDNADGTVNAHGISTGTATITYSRIVGPCVPGSPCSETVFFTSPKNPATYPFRVDASFREQGGTLTDVRIVRIH